MTARTTNLQTSDAKLPSFRQLGRWLLGLVLMMALAGVSTWVTVKVQDPYFMPLKLIRIDGQLRHLSREAVESAVGKVIQGNFFTVDVARVRNAAEGLAWVERVSVRRVWPGTLQLQVIEQVPLARWGKEQLVNRQGQVFTPAPEEIPAGLPWLSGPEGHSAAVVLKYLKLRPRFTSVGLNLAQVRMDARQAWQMAFENGLQLRLGNQDSDRRVERFLRIYPRLQQMSERRLLGLDFRYTNGFSALWAPADTQLKGVEKVAAVGKGQA
ncbi:MAG: cell division protein FtsQ/DivIB [Gammaproteobacteria bacterium]|nr:cell division protein FtsQ/DivIB [Gammaproteobacteria bacterium]